MDLLRGGFVQMLSDPFDRRLDRRPLAARKPRDSRGLVHLRPIAAAAMLALLGLSACAVGPDFQPPPPPAVTGYTPESAPRPTASVDVAAGAAQKFVMGRDIPGDWWTVFHSTELNGLIAEALRSNPNLQAAQATLWQAKENLYAQA